MTHAAWILLSVAGVYALADWYAVATGHRQLEWIAKPATLAALIGAAAVIHPDDRSTQAAFLVALAFSLAGDVFLMLPDEQFVAGLASFLVGHLAYVVGLVLAGVSWPGVVVGLVVVSAAAALVGRPLVRAVQEDEPKLVGPVVAYMAAISAMVVLALGTGNPWAIAGALLFYASDALLGWNRFVGPIAHERLGVHMTYHLGQAGLVAAIASL